MVVYGDLLFMINFSMDFLCFYFSCLLTHRKLPNLRAVIASSLGGIYSVVVLFMSVKQPLAFILDVFALFLMCAIEAPGWLFLPWAIGFSIEIIVAVLGRR